MRMLVAAFQKIHDIQSLRESKQVMFPIPKQPIKIFNFLRALDILLSHSSKIQSEL